MFKIIKIKRERKRFETLKQELISEREKLEQIKSILEDKSPKLNINDVYVFEYGDIRQIVKKVVRLTNGFDCSGRFVSVFDTKFIDIGNNIIYKDCSTEKVKNGKIFISTYSDYFDGKNHDAYITPILEVFPELLLYPDKLVPKYVLEKLTYDLNNVDCKKKIKKLNNTWNIKKLWYNVVSWVGEILLFNL